MGVAYSLANIHVVVLGGGYAGVATAKQALAAGFRVTLVEVRDKFLHVIGSPRTTVEAGFETSLHILYDRALPASPRLTRLRGTCTAVNSATKKLTVHLAGGDDLSLSYDFLVIATGTAAWHTEAPASESSVAAMRADAALRVSISAAQSVVVIGGGAVGVEVAGEIKTEFPSKTVTLIHSGKTLMSSEAAGKLPASFTSLLLDRVHARGITVHLGAKALGHAFDARTAVSDGLTVVRRGVYEGSDIIRIEGSTEQIPCDVQLWLTGAAVPNTQFTRSDPVLAAACDPAGFLRVNASWQVVGLTYVFALGDVSTGSGDGKYAWIVTSQASEVVGNMVKLASGAAAAAAAAAKASTAAKETGAVIGTTEAAATAAASKPALRIHLPTPARSLMAVVMVGRKGGAMHVFGLNSGDAAVWAVKSHDALVGKTNREFGFSVAETKALNAAALLAAVSAASLEKESAVLTKRASARKDAEGAIQRQVELLRSASSAQKLLRQQMAAATLDSAVEKAEAAGGSGSALSAASASSTAPSSAASPSPSLAAAAVRSLAPVLEEDAALTSTSAAEAGHTTTPDAAPLSGSSDSSSSSSGAAAVSVAAAAASSSDKQFDEGAGADAVIESQSLARAAAPVVVAEEEDDDEATAAVASAASAGGSVQQQQPSTTAAKNKKKKKGKK